MNENRMVIENKLRYRGDSQHSDMKSIMESEQIKYYEKINYPSNSFVPLIPERLNEAAKEIARIQHASFHKLIYDLNK